MERDSAVISEPVPSGWSAATVELAVPIAQWGDRQLLEVTGTHDDECDWVNNRHEIWDDPFAE